MKSKVFKIFMLVFIAQIFLYACCGDEFNVNMQSFEFSAEDLGDDDNTTASNTDFNLLLTPYYRYELASLLSSKSGFIPTAYATSCMDDYTFINHVEEITLTANVPLFGIPAGESLNERVLVEFQYDDDVQHSMNEFLLKLNSDLSDLDYNLTFDTEIPSETTASFTFTVVFENDEELVRTTNPVTFSE